MLNPHAISAEKLEFGFLKEIENFEAIHFVRLSALTMKSL